MCVCVHNVVQIISRCDIALLQEVRDHKEKAIPILLAGLNRYTKTITNHTETFCSISVEACSKQYESETIYDQSCPML